MGYKRSVAERTRQRSHHQRVAAASFERASCQRGRPDFSCTFCPVSHLFRRLLTSSLPLPKKGLPVEAPEDRVSRRHFFPPSFLPFNSHQGNNPSITRCHPSFSLLASSFSSSTASYYYYCCCYFLIVSLAHCTLQCLRFTRYVISVLTSLSSSVRLIPPSPDLLMPAQTSPARRRPFPAAHSAGSGPSRRLFRHNKTGIRRSCTGTKRPSWSERRL